MRLNVLPSPQPSTGSPRARAAAGERNVTAFAILLAAGFVALAVASLAAPAAARLGSWVPLHLLLAGAGPVAVAGVMPFFSAAVAGAPPARFALRLVGVLAIAGGALLIVGGRAGWAGEGNAAAIATGGGVLYLIGLVGVAAATLLPLRVALGPRRMFIGAAYGLAMVSVLLGAGLATLFVLGWPPVLVAWGTLKPAHAWLNVFGFLSLVIAGSLLHLLPTVVGARIRRTTASVVAFAALGSGPLLAAAGFAITSDLIALAGGGLTILGAGALAAHAVTVMRARARWTTDHRWHTFTSWSLVAGIGWFLLATLAATAQVLAGGATARGWLLEPLLAPLAVGWVGQVLVGAWSHLLPAVGPGDPLQHAAQRRILGTLALPRLLLLNGGALALVIGDRLAAPALATAGLAAVLLSALAAVGLFALALTPVLVRRSGTQRGL